MCMTILFSLVQVVVYLLGETNFTASSSDSDDSDSDGLSLLTQRMHKLWAYPKLINTKDHTSEI